MPQAMTFNSLKTDVRNYLERGASAATDPIVYDQIPKLINLGERHCVQKLKVEGFIEAFVSTMTTGTPAYAKPDRWRKTVSINYGTGTGNNTMNILLPRSYEYCITYAPDDTITGPPLFYAEYDYQHWRFSPCPDAAYPFQVLAYCQPALLDDAVQTNWLTTYAPNLLLYASLLEATPFLKNDERIPTWQGLFEEAAANISQEDLSKIFDRNAQRNGV